jgi:hypothetical protein
MVLIRWTVGLESAPAQAVSLILSLGLGFASYRFVEQPIRKSATLASWPRWRVVGLGVAASAGAAGLVGVLFLAANMLTLSVVGHRSVWSPFAPVAAEGAPCAVSVDSVLAVKSARESADIVPHSCRPSARPYSIFVLGDSHAGAYRRMLVASAANQDAHVLLLSKGGCRLFNLITPNDRSSTACGRFTSAAVAQVASRIGKGDVLFLPSMRVARLGEMWGGVGPPAPKDPATEARDRLAAMDEASALVHLATSRGANVIVEAPLPVFRAPPFRCADWFNRMNPVCSPGFEVPRALEEAHRAEALRALAQLQRRNPAVKIWDPMPVICPGTACTAFKSGQPLFFDGDHLSGYGDDVLAPDFERFLGTLRRPAA